eukprot:COSAG06_NODE_33763_length_484_cov_1.467532_1_plen_119_part_01
MCGEAERLGADCQGGGSVPQLKLLFDPAPGALARAALRAQEDEVLPLQLLPLPDCKEGAKNAHRSFAHCHFILKTIISPRQARDKHRESSTQTEAAARFLLFSGSAWGECCLSQARRIR